MGGIEYEILYIFWGFAAETSEVGRGLTKSEMQCELENIGEMETYGSDGNRLVFWWHLLLTND